MPNQGSLLQENPESISGSGGGVNSINADNSAAQTLTVGVAGADFNIANPGAGSHIFNLPTASAITRGALSSADWSKFNSKMSPIAFNVRDYGAVGNGIRVQGVVSAVLSQNVTIAAGAFTVADIGKTVVCYNNAGAGTITTILAVVNPTHITLAVNAGILLAGGVGTFIAYGTDDSAAFGLAMVAAAAVTNVDNTVGPNQPFGAGKAVVYVPDVTGEGLYFLTSGVIVLGGVMLQADGMLFNAISNRFTPILTFIPYSGSFGELKIDSCFGQGIQLGTLAGTEAHIEVNDIVLWNVGKTTSGGGVDQVGLNHLGYDFRGKKVWCKGGVYTMFNLAGADLCYEQVFCIGAKGGIYNNGTNQANYGVVYIDTCNGADAAHAGFVVDNGSSNIRANINAFDIVSSVQTLAYVAAVGKVTAVQNTNINLNIQASNTGGIVLGVDYIQASAIVINATNLQSAVDANNPITTAVEFGTHLNSTVKITAFLQGTILPSSGVQYNGYDYYASGTQHWNANVATLDNAGNFTSATAITTGTIQTTAGRMKPAKGADVIAANNLTLGTDGNVFVITGNTQINLITTTNWPAGSPITLEFTGTPTIKHGQVAVAGLATILLSGGVDFSASNPSILNLVYDGTSWQEKSRSVNHA